jgi:hypothetical protein
MPSLSNDKYSTSNCFYGTQRFVTLFATVCYRLCTYRIFTIYRVAQKSVNLLVKCTIKYSSDFFITYWIYKNCSKWDPPCSVHKSQRCDTVLQIHWQVYIWTFPLIRENVLGWLTFGPLCITYANIKISSNMIVPLKSIGSDYEILLLFRGINFTLYDVYLFH